VSLSGCVVQQLPRWSENVSPDRKRRIFAPLELTQLSSERRKQFTETKGLGDIIVGT
jgi:hypothetical protein